MSIASRYESLQGIRIGMYSDWFRDAHNEVVKSCEELLTSFVSWGATMVDSFIPNLRLIAIAHAQTIHTEMTGNMERYDREHRRDSRLATRLMLANVRVFRLSDYVQAQRIRSQAIEEFGRH